MDQLHEYIYPPLNPPSHPHHPPPHLSLTEPRLSSLLHLFLPLPVCPTRGGVYGAELPVTLFPASPLSVYTWWRVELAPCYTVHTSAPCLSYTWWRGGVYSQSCSAAYLPPCPPHPLYPHVSFLCVCTPVPTHHRQTAICTIFSAFTFVC